ncbi:hypothetical protein HPB50_002107 [Hyalomma asiaticum]|uniref:Uncharacterized protein n=1 Tax=Hyalomma asiaticum TaxID=266040 RepID=A0ACB7RGH6_HYAAI|nr:hypothetical protein HPB50_002107 [Hyalomma asiaticum]
MPSSIPEPGNTISTTTKCWEYTLTGFGEFLEQRSVAFSSEMPEGRICSMCDLVSPVSSVLPCGHILCEFCKGRAGRECPMDGKGFAAKGLKRLELTMSELDHMTVVCVRKNGQTCSFTGKISRASETSGGMRHGRW